MTDALTFGGDVPPSVYELKHGEFLKAVQWNKHTPQPMKRAAAHGDVEKFSQRLGQRRCAARSGGTGKRVTRPAIDRPALWSQSLFPSSARVAELIAVWEAFGTRLQRPTGKQAVRAYRKATSRKQTSDESNHADNGREEEPTLQRTSQPNNWFANEAKLGEWLAGITSAAELQPEELLILLEMLPAVGRELSPPLRWTLWRTALTGSLELSAKLDEPSETDVNDERQTIIRGELPYEAGVLFAGVKGAGKLRKQGAKFLARQLRDATDTDGTPEADLLPRLPLWLATFVRVRQWARAFRERLWNASTEERFIDLVRVATGLCRTDGRLALSNGVPLETLPILTTAAATSGFQKKSQPMRLLQDVQDVTARTAKRKKGSARPKPLYKKRSKSAAKRSAYGWPVTQSDWAKLACLRSDWSLDADLLAVAHDGRFPRIDLSIRGKALLQGEWTLEVALNDRPVELTDEWECSCWFSDGDVDFLELRQQTNSGLVIDRQLALSRTDHFAALVDCIQGGGEKPISYAAAFHPVDEATAETDSDTREIRAGASKGIARLFPLSLPCDRVEGAAGAFAVTEHGGIQLTQSALGGLVAPVIIDWGPKRRKKNADWQRLTVGDAGQPVGFEAAAGYRLRVGDLHLVVYRSLKRSETGRTVLGLHTHHETVIGHFTADGEIDPLLEVE